MAKPSWNPLMDRELMRDQHKPMKKKSGYSSSKRAAERKAEQEAPATLWRQGAHATATDTST